jgi:putative transposase
VNAVLSLDGSISRKAACEAVGVSRATVYRRTKPKTPRTSSPPDRALDVAEKQRVLEVLHEPRFVDRAPEEVFYTLLDEDTYLCSTRTMYRVLDAHDEVKERRAIARHPKHAAPQLIATGPNQVWSWDITRLRTFLKFSYLYLYVVIDIFSRYVVGWMTATTETAGLAKRLIAETVDREGVAPKVLTLHADRGTQMTSKTLAQLLSELDVVRSFSRPHVSNDNPFSEAQFKTAKYHPSFPERFGVIDDARAHFQTFMPWYNHEHRHSGIAFLTPADVHFGRAQAVLARRHATMLTAYGANPERFPHGPPRALTLPQAVYINPPPNSASAPPSSAGPRVGTGALDGAHDFTSTSLPATINSGLVVEEARQ